MRPITSRPLRAVCVVGGMCLGVAGAIVAFDSVQQPNVLWTVIGIIATVLGILLVRTGRYGHLFVPLVVLALLPFVLSGTAHAQRVGQPAGTYGASVYNNAQVAYTRVGHVRLFTTDLQVSYRWNWSEHRVWINWWRALPSVSTLGSTEGWTMDAPQLVEKGCFDVAGYNNGQSGCGVEVEINWHDSCIIHLCGSTETRYMRSFVYFDGNVQHDNTSTP